MKRDLAEMSDEELLAFTQPLDEARETHTVTCVDCGEVVEVENARWNLKRCPNCQRTHIYGENLHHDRRRTGDGLKNGILMRRR